MQREHPDRGVQMGIDLQAIKKRQQQTWASGDFAMIATTNIIVGELLCEAVDLRPGQKVLDVATGSGNTALAAARRWCEVTTGMKRAALSAKPYQRPTRPALPASNRRRI